MIRKILFLNLFLSISLSGFCQIGGSHVFEFMNIPASARIASLGGTLISIKDNDLTLATQNPAMLNPSMHQMLTFSGCNYFAGIKYGDAGYARYFKKYGTFQTAVHFVDYGTFTRTDNAGDISGTFKAAEYEFMLGWGYEIDSMFSVGINLKPIYSELEHYTSFAMAADIAATYYNRKKEIVCALVIKNIGKQIKEYTAGNTEPLPYEVEAGFSKRMEHVPFRFNMTIRHLEKFDLSYLDPAKANQIDPITGQATTEEITFADKLMRHFIFGGELLLTKNFHLRIGYNYQRRKELGFETSMGGAGFSWGVGFRISKFLLSYGRATYNVAGGSDHFSFSTNLSDFFTKADKGDKTK